MPSNPNNKALKRVTEKVEGALKGNSSVLRGAVAKKAVTTAQEWWRRPNKGGNSDPIRATTVAQ